MVLRRSHISVQGVHLTIGRIAAMPKFQRQATHANESDILHLIDERFEELEE